LLRLGGSEVITRDDLEGDPERTLGPERWAGAVDCVGGATLTSVLRTLRYGAAVAASGLTGGSTFESSVYPFIVRGTSLIGVDTVQCPMVERRKVWSEMATEYPPDLLEDMVHAEVGLDELGAALELIVAGGGQGSGAGGPVGLTAIFQPVYGAVVWLFDPTDRKTGDTTSVPPPHGAMVAFTVRWSIWLGGVTSTAAEVGQLVSPPTGTSE
jgi:hypothetical protein